MTLFWKQSALEYLVGSLDPFLREHWEKQPLHLPGAAGRFDRIATMDQIDEILSRQNLQHPQIQAIQDGAQIPASRLTREWRYGGHALELIDEQVLLSLFRAGATIRINGLEKLSVPSLEFCRAMAEDTGAHVAVNAYLAPSGSGQNFDAHYDLCDAFALQLSGTKTWRLWKNPRPLPLADEPHDPAEIARTTARTPDHDITLSPGHLLYLPRGTIHAPSTTDAASVHLLVAIAPYRWFDVVQAEIERISAELMEDERYRRGFPMMPDADRYFDRAETEALFDQMVADAITKIDLRRSISSLEKRVMARQHRAVPSMIENRDRFENLSLDDELTICPHLLFALEDGERSVSLSYFDRTLTLPPRARDAIHQIARERSVRVSAIDPKLGPDERLVIARRLLKEGFLVFA